MMRLATAATLLLVFATTPALAIVCEARCLEHTPQTNRGSHTKHSHHHEGTQSSDFGLRSSVLETGRDHTCLSHVDPELGAPERSTLIEAELAPGPLRLLCPVVVSTCVGWVDEIRPPPLDPHATTPLRI